MKSSFSRVFILPLFFFCFSFFLLPIRGEVSGREQTLYLIQEMESLRNSLEQDDPARVDLTLRLADLYFDVSIKESEGNEKKDLKLLKAQRLKALDLYRNSLEGRGGQRKAKGLHRLKIQFQMARLLTRLEENKMAEKYYLPVVSSSLPSPKMKEQAALALAEWYEEDVHYKKSHQFYDKALDLCELRSSCNYAHYRKAWLYFKDSKLSLAIAQMKDSLWSTVANPSKKIQGEVRESSLQDLILFMSHAETNGSKELSFIRSLATQLKRPQLVIQLAEAFYSAGNRRGGSHLLAYLNEEKPNLYYKVRLLEEFYGFRNWEKTQFYLHQIVNQGFKNLPEKKEQREGIHKILKRYLVQVAAEAEVVPELNSFLKQSIDIFLALYPRDDLRQKLQQGWLKAEGDELKKIDRLAQWIREERNFGAEKKEIRKLRQTRLSLAQKRGEEHQVVLEESLAIAELLKDSKESTNEADEFQYVAAREYYALKKYDKALPLFKELVSKAIEEKEFSHWAVLSQNLILDIFNQRKNYQGIIDQVALWKKGDFAFFKEGKGNLKEQERKKKTLARETKAMERIQRDARFQKAAQMPDSPSSLDAFYHFCFQGVYPKKSCSNAKVLALKFSDQGKLISLLEKEGDEKALMNEYELMGRFEDAAKLQEKLLLRPLGKKASPELYLKIALLYELEGNFYQRDRILKNLIQKIRNEKHIPQNLEGTLFLTFDEAGMLNLKTLFLPWSTKRKLDLARRLEVESPHRVTQKIIMKEEQSQGPIWSSLLLKDIQGRYKKVSTLSFYGKGSKWRFKKRTNSIERFVSYARPKLEGADGETRIYILHMLTKIYGKMSEDILATPLPPDLDSQTMAQVKEQLKEMSRPFEKVRDDYRHLLDEQFLAFDKERPGDRQRIAHNLSLAKNDYAQFIQVKPYKKPLLIREKFSGISSFKKTLEKDPLNRNSLQSLEKYFREKEMLRLSAYYLGRLESLSPSETQSPKALGKGEKI